MTPIQCIGHINLVLPQIEKDLNSGKSGNFLLHDEF